MAFSHRHSIVLWTLSSLSKIMCTTYYYLVRARRTLSLSLTHTQTHANEYEREIYARNRIFFLSKCNSKSASGRNSLQKRNHAKMTRPDVNLYMCIVYSERTEKKIDCAIDLWSKTNQSARATNKECEVSIWRRNSTQRKKKKMERTHTHTIRTSGSGRRMF